MKTRLALLAMIATAAYGQGVTGSITGLVTDPSASVVSDAKVSVKNTLTGVATTTTTNAAGVYNIPSLTAGAYDDRSRRGPQAQEETIQEIPRSLRAHADF